MAIQYIGNTISGVSGDTKPTLTANEKGVIFVETDTNKIYQWDTDSWNITTAIDATTSVKGVASFDSGDFSVSSGAVSLADNITIAGNLTVSGTTNTVNATNLLIEDPLIVLAKDQSGSAAWDAGFVVERGNDNNMALIWDESTDKFSFIQANSEVGSTAGNVTINDYADLKAKNIEVTNVLTVTGNSTFGGNVSLGDSDYLYIGASNDLQIYHNGSNSYIADTGTGALIVKTNILSIRNAADDEQLIYAGQDNQVDLYHNGSKKFETTAAGIAVSGSATVTHNSNYMTVAEHSSNNTFELKLVGAADHDAALYFGDANDPVEAGFWWDTSEAKLHFQGHNNATRMTIDNVGNVGIGTTSPSSYHANADDLVVYSTGNTGMTLATNDQSSGRGAIYFSDGTSSDAEKYAGYITYLHSNNTMYFGTNGNGTAAFYIDSSQEVHFGNNNLYDVGHATSVWDNNGLRVGGTNGWQIGNTAGVQRISNNSGTFSMLNSSNAWANVEMAALQVNGAISMYNSGTLSLTAPVEVTGATNSFLDIKKADAGTGNLRFLNGSTEEFRIWLDNAESRLGFSTDGGSTNAMAILESNGHIGIGTSSPTHKLHLSDPSRVDIKFSNDNDDDHYIRKDGDYLRFRGHDDSTVILELRNNDHSNVSSFPNGRLGVGTDSPSYSFHVEESSGTTPRIYIKSNGSNDAIFDTDAANDVYWIMRRAGTAKWAITNNHAPGTDTMAIYNYVRNKNVMSFQMGGQANDVVTAIGCNPTSNWYEGNTVLMLGGHGVIFTGTTGAAGQSMWVGYNTEQRNSSFNAINEDEGSYMEQQNGNIMFKTAPSVTAGSAQTFTERFRIALGGQLGIGGANYGTDGQVLTSTGASTPPAWEDAGGGGGGTMQLTVASGHTITPGMAVGVNSSGQAVEYTTTGADYIPPIMYSYPETQSTYTIRSPEIAYDTETNIHVMMFTKFTASNGEDVRDGGVNQGVFAVPFEIDANDNITFGTEMRITSDRSLYGYSYHLQYLETRQQMVAVITVSTTETVVFLLKPKATNPTTVVASSELSLTLGAGNNYYKTMFADASSGSDHRGIISYTGGSYYTKVRVLDFGTAWNETQGAAHGITVGSETNLYNQASYNAKPGVWMRSTHSGGGKQMCVFGYYAFRYGFDIGTSGTTVSNVTIGNWGPSQPRPHVAVYTGTPGWAFVYASYSSYQSYLIPVSISSNNSTSEGTVANGPGGGGTGDSGMQGLVYTGTTNTMMVINGRNSGTPSGGELPGNGSWSNQKGKYTKRMSYNTSSGWLVSSPHTTVDVADLFLNPYAQGEHEGLGSIGHDFDPDRSRVVIASTTTAGNPSRGDLSEARFGTYAARTTGIWMMKISGTTAPLDNYGTLAGMFVGFGADASNVTAGNTVTVTIKGGVNERQSGLVVGQHYFMNEFGTLYANGLPDIHQVSLYVGRAVSATKLLVDGSKGWSFR